MQHVLNLLAAMTSQEKAHFSSLNKQDRHRSFYKIYKLLLTNPNISFKRVEARFSDIPQIRYEINNLYNRLLKSLVSLQLNSKEPVTRLQNQIRMARILMEKKNNKESSKMLRKAKSYAEKNEKFPELLLVLKLEEDLLFKNMTAEIYERIEALYYERDGLLHKMKEYYDLCAMARTIIRIQYIEGMHVAFDRLPKMIRNSPILNEQENGSSIRGDYMANFTRGLRSITTGQYVEAAKYQVRVIEVLRQHKFLGSVTNLLANINNLLASLAMANREEEFQHWIEELRKVRLSKASDHRLALFYELAQVGGFITRWLKLEDYPMYEERAMKFLDANNKGLTQTQINNLSFSLIYGAVFRLDYDRAQGHMVRLLSLPVNDYAKPRIRMISVCIYIGQGNIDLAQNELEAFKRACKNKDKINPVTTTFIAYIKGLLSNRTDRQLKQLAVDTLNKFQLQYEDLSLRQNFVQFNLINWMKICQSKYLR